MEVCDKSVEHLELITRVNEDICKSLASLDFAELSSDALESTARGSADSDDPSAVFLCLTDKLGCFCGNLVVLAVHFVVSNVVNLNGTEGAKTDMKGDVCDFYTLSADPVHKLLGEVQSRCRSRRRTELVAVNSLIAFFVLELFCNVRGKRHLPDFIEGGEEVFVAVKVHNSVAVVLYLSDLGSQQTVAEAEFCSGLCFFSGLT